MIRPGANHKQKNIIYEKNDDVLNQVVKKQPMFYAYEILDIAIKLEKNGE